LKKIILFLLLTVTLNFYGQIHIEGTVISENNLPIESASVYLNNTTIGTTTNKNGAFKLQLKPGTYELIISYLGFQTIKYTIDAENYTKPKIFKLLTETNFLDEVIVKKIVYDDDWKYNLSRFKKAFLGRTELAKNCKLLNPKTLSFEFNAKTGILTAQAKEPIEILNKGLGYLVTFDLVDFSLGRELVTYTGHTKYQQLKGSKGSKNSVKKNRLKAYNGSTMHFTRSLYNLNSKKEGFVINQFKRVPNPERPSEEEIKKARELAQLSNVNQYTKINIVNPKTIVDSAYVILDKVSLPKYKDYLYLRDVPYNNMVVKRKDSTTLLKFNNYLSITYTLEKEESNYLIGTFKKKKASGVQTSAITMTTNTAIIEPSGYLVDPLAIFSEGYWSYEKFADLLPLDYFPTKD
tara:strand:+ start:249451 stop:250671 length:1221 start_codon:yes stop_codon:yes gene_type:complete